VTPDPDIDDDREDLEALATEITETVEIRLEHEAHYDWVAFVPQRESDAGALTKYFGKVAGADEFKLRGIEPRQRSTPPFIEKSQRSVSNDSMRPSHRKQSSPPFEMQSISYTPARSRSSNSSNGIASPSH